MKRTLFLCAVGLGLTCACFAQTPASDRQLLAERDFRQGAALGTYRRAPMPVRQIQYRQRSWLARYNPVSLALTGAMLGYQQLMSKQLARSCPYQLSCSNFSKQAIEQFGVVKGVFLSADRIMRCNRIGLLDVSPVDMNPADGLVIDSLSRYR